MTPRASVIVPTYYSAATLEACLEGLRAQTFQDFEVIVVNSSPEEHTARVVRGSSPEVIFEQVPERLLPHAARNRGVELSRGSLLVFTDPDCRPRPDWLAKLVGAADSGHELVVGGHELEGRSWFERGAHLCKYSTVLPTWPAGGRRVAATAGALCTRRLWDAVGPFDGTLWAGDAELSWRAAQVGQAPWFEPAAVVAHRHLGTVRTFWRDRVERGADFAFARARFEGWSRPRAAVQLAALPLAVALMVARTGRDALRCGWERTFVETLPLQALGDAAWCVGEGRFLLAFLANAKAQLSEARRAHLALDDHAVP
jgi:GT2 family glycosyltransferase